MVRLILFLCVLFMFGELLFMLLSNKKSTTIYASNNTKSKINQSAGDIKDDRYYWYNHPHYHITSSGEKINLAEYLTYDEYINLSKDKEKFMQYCCQLENRLNKKDKITDFDIETGNMKMKL